MTMEDHHDIDKMLKDALENLPEEQPTEKDWQQLRAGLEGAKLIGSDRGGRLPYIYILAAVITTFTTVSLLHYNHIIEAPANALVVQAPEFTKDNPSVASASVTNAHSVQANETVKSHAPVKMAVTSSPRTMASVSASVVSNNAPVNKTTALVSSGNAKQVETSSGLVAGHSKDFNSIPSHKNASLAKPSKEITTEEHSPVAVTSQTENALPEQTILRVSGISIIPVTGVNSDLSYVAQSNLQGIRTDESLNASSDPKDLFPPVLAAPVRKFRLGPYASLDFGRYEVRKSSKVLSSDAEFAAKSDLIKGTGTNGLFTLGLTAGYLFSSRWELELGGYYSQKEKLNDFIATPVYINGYTTEYSTFTYYYNGKYIDLSGKLKYRVPFNDRYTFYFAGGGLASYNFPVSKEDRGYYIRRNYTSEEITYDKVWLEPSSASISLMFGAGVEAKMTDRWLLFVEPMYKHGINPVIKHPSYDYIPVNHYWRIFSFGAGINYLF